MEQRKDDNFDEEQSDSYHEEDWIPDDEEDEWMDVEEWEEESEDELIGPNTNNMMEEEKVPAARHPKKRGAWSAYYHQHESVAGIYHIHQSLTKEQDKAIKQLKTKTLTFDRQKIKTLAKHNELFYNPTNHKAHLFQSFIPNKVFNNFSNIGTLTRRLFCLFIS